MKEYKVCQGKMVFEIEKFLLIILCQVPELGIPVTWLYIDTRGGGALGAEDSPPPDFQALQYYIQYTCMETNS